MFRHFYHGTLTKITKAFGNLFNRIYVVRYEGEVEKERVLVPINYANRHSYIARIEAQPLLEDNIYVETIFPRMAYEITGITYDSNRKLNTIHKHAADMATDHQRNTAYQSVAYNIDFSLTIVAKHMTDANQILEQILPYFTPSYTITIKSIPEMEYEEDIPIELVGVQFSDNYQQEFDEQRQIRYDLSFVAKVQFHGPVDISKLIKKVQVDILNPKDFDSETLAKTPRIVRHEVEPNPTNANPDEDFGYTESWTEFQDGKKYNPVTDADEEIPS